MASEPWPPAVIGHTEWVEFAQLDHLPAPGEGVDVEPIMQLAAGGGAVAAVELADLAGHALLFTALGDDELGHQALAQLKGQGLDVYVAWRPLPTRRVLTLIPPDGERTIIHIGRLLEPSGEDSLPWHLLDRASGAYFTAGDAAALEQSRRSPTLVVSPRPPCLSAADVVVDAVTYSATDDLERDAVNHLKRPPRIRVETSGSNGGRYWTGDSRGSFAAAPLPAPPVDGYGCGDAFAAGLTFGLASNLGIDRTLALAAERGASCLTRRGPYAPLARA